MEVGRWPRGLEGGAHALLGRAHDAVRQRELDFLRVAFAVHVGKLQNVGALDFLVFYDTGADDLDGARAGAVAAGHFRVHGVDGVVERQRPVLAVHIVGASPAVVPQPHAVVLDVRGILFANFIHIKNLASGLLHVAVLHQRRGEQQTQRTNDKEELGTRRLALFDFR